MPLPSRKRKLITQICEEAFGIMFLEDFQNMDHFDKVIDDLLQVASYRYSIPRINKVPKSQEWYQNVLPNYGDADFQRFLRVSREDFYKIYVLIEDSKVFKGPNSQRQFKIEQQLALTLHKLGHDGSGSGIVKTGGLFGVGGGGTIMKVVERVLDAILELEKEWIKWPDADERKQIVRVMEDQLPNCIGYIDGSHVRLDEAPIHDPESYFSRKQDYCIQLQAICDNNRLIRNIFVGYPGSVHDGRVFASSAIGRSPQLYLTEGQWIAGDSAYRNSDHLITPFRRNSNQGTQQERSRFNKYFCGFRVKIECTFGILKEIFGSLKGLRIRIDEKRGHKLACKWITACCILYNIIKDNYSYEDDEHENEQEDSEDNTGRDNDNKRRALLEWINRNLNLRN